MTPWRQIKLLNISRVIFPKMNELRSVIFVTRMKGLLYSTWKHSVFRLSDRFKMFDRFLAENNFHRFKFSQLEIFRCKLFKKSADEILSNFWKNFKFNITKIRFGQSLEIIFPEIPIWSGKLIRSRFFWDEEKADKVSTTRFKCIKISFHMC